MNNVINVEEKNVELFNSNDECNFSVSEKRKLHPVSQRSAMHSNKRCKLYFKQKTMKISSLTLLLSFR